MGIFSKFENRMEDTFEGAAGKMSKAPISPVQIAKKAEKQMRRETIFGSGGAEATAIYTVLVNPDDDARLFGYYPTLAGETETYLSAKAMEQGLVMDGEPLVRFVVDDGLRHGKFDVIAELVAAPIVAQLRDEEMQRYGIAPRPQYAQQAPQNHQQDQQAPQGYQQQPQQQEAYAEEAWASGYLDFIEPEPEPAPPQRKPPLPYVPEEEIDRSIDYGEYTFNSEDFEDYRDKAADSGEFVDDGYAYPQSIATPEPQPVAQQPNTAAFVGGANPTPNRRIVHARLIDLTYQRPYDLAGTLITMGRDSHNDIVVQDINASRKHAELRLTTQGIWTITDLKSMNGTLVNGISIASHPLYPGDVVTIGKTDFQFTVY